MEVPHAPDELGKVQVTVASPLRQRFQSAHRACRPKPPARHGLHTIAIEDVSNSPQAHRAVWIVPLEQW
jgi:hypothetical protein